MTSHEFDVERDLDIARNLVRAGVPVFVARPHTEPCDEWCRGKPDTGFHLPGKWETSTPTLDVVDRWRPGWALCAVMGHAVDLADVDPRNGGDGTAAGMKAAGSWPRSYGHAATPSGGTHDFIAPLGVGSHDNVAPGLDVKGGKPDGTSRGFAFIAPTVRTSKTTGLAERYRWLVEPDLAKLSDAVDDTGEQLAALVGRAVVKRPHLSTPDDTLGAERFTGPLGDGQRYPGLRSYAGYLRFHLPRLSRGEYELLCWRRWKDCVQPPVSEYEWPWTDALVNPVRDIWDRYAAGDPLAAGRAVADDDAPDSWAPLDLGPYLRGEVSQPEPTMGLRRSDGLRLLYPGRENAVIGEMESGKTWFAGACVAAELDQAHHVVYVHFEETDPADLIGRLRALGVSDAVMTKFLRFVAPARQVSSDALAALLDPAPSLVVFDGVNEAMSLHKWAIREEDGAASFRRYLVMPCLRVGAGTLSADHVVKSVEARGRHAIGSIHKGNGINGALVLLENAEPFGRGARGRSHVFITKDRPGFLRQHGRPDAKLPGKTFMGELVVDDSQTLVPELELRFWAPKTPETGAAFTDPWAFVEAKVLTAVADITAAGHLATLRMTRVKSALAKDTVDQVLARLTLDGRLVETPGARGSRVFTVAEDHSSESAS